MQSLKVRAWTPAEDRFLCESRQSGHPYRVIGEKLNRSSKSCECHFRETDWSNRKYNLPDDLIDSEEKSEAVNKLDVSYNNKLDMMRIRADHIADRVVSSIKPLPTAPPVYQQGKKPLTKGNPEDVGLIISDIHIGHNFTMEDTGGLAKFDFETVLERVENLKHGVTEVVELHRNLYKIPKMHIFCLGDIVDGMNDVGKWSAAYIDMPIIDQMTSGVQVLAGMIYYWLGMFEEINFYGISGNHGKSAKKGVEREYVNWDYVCYQMLETMFKNNPRVKFNCPKTWWIQTEIRNHSFLMLHGEDVKGGNFPVKSLATVEQKMMGLTGKIANYTMVGHFHSAAELSTNHGRLLINGSFIGPNVYSLKDLQLGGKAEQKIFGIHDTRGITWTYNIDLESKRN